MPSRLASSNRTSDRRESLTKLCYNEIRDRILLSYYRGGQVLIEGALAQEFGVSKTPVREALSLLVHEGFLTLLPRTGYRVPTVSLEDVQEVYDVRVLLEGECAAMAAANATDQEILGWRTDLEARSRLLESSDAGLRDYLKFDEAVHMGIARLTGNRILARVVAQLLREATRLSTTCPFAGIANLRTEIETRMSLIEALTRHDAAACRELMREHVQQWRSHVFETVTRQTAQQERRRQKSEAD